jgi:hypothetical protein
MGIRSWLGMDKPETPAPVLPGPPTNDQLLAALGQVELMARDGSVPGVVMSRLLRVTGIVRETIPRLPNLGLGSPQGYSVMATATDYLPVAIGNYLRLPRDWADSRPIENGKSSVMLLVDQLDLLGSTMDKVYDAVCRADAEAIVIHGQFLQQKFGAAASGGSLALGAPSEPMLRQEPANGAPAAAGPLEPPD